MTYWAVPNVLAQAVIPSPSEPRRISTFGLEPRCQVSFDRLGLVARRIAFQYRAVGAHEEFGKVPLDRLSAQNPRLLRFEVLVERVRIHAVYFDLCEHREGDAEVPGAELFDLCFAARLLLSELITGEPEHHEIPVLEFVVERLQPRVLRREPALARDIDDEQRLATVAVHLLRLAVDGDEVDVVQVHRFRMSALRERETFYFFRSTGSIGGVGISLREREAPGNGS
jgi:hypothetical protein